MMASSNTTTTVALQTSDKVLFKVDVKVASISVLLKDIIEGTTDEDVHCTMSTMPLPLVDSKTLSIVLEYCEKHAAAAAAEELKKWDKEYIEGMDLETLSFILTASNYLNIPGLLELGCQSVADQMRGKRPEEIRKTFGIKNDLSPEEEEETRKEYARAFEEISDGASTSNAS